MGHSQPFMGLPTLSLSDAPRLHSMLWIQQLWLGAFYVAWRPTPVDGFDSILRWLSCMLRRSGAPCTQDKRPLVGLSHSARMNGSRIQFFFDFDRCPKSIPKALKTPIHPIGVYGGQPVTRYPLNTSENSMEKMRSQTDKQSTKTDEN